MSDAMEQASGQNPDRQYASRERGKRRTLEGKVVSNKMQKTLVVSIERKVKHPKYHKYIRRHTKVYAHDEKGEGRPGDLVRLTESRPMSKTKRFSLLTVLKRGGEGVNL